MLHELLRRLHDSNEKQDKDLYPFYESIQHIAYSAKAREDARESLIILQFSESLMVRERMQTIKEDMIDLYILLSQVIEKYSFKGYKKSIDAVLEHITHSNEELLDLLGKHLHRQAMPKGELSSLLHLISAIQRSHTALVKGMKPLW